ncbi:MAG TPA: alanine racemase [Terriglobia bacterium]|nr:alanine racemase [Terriglobia bacterium]
MLSWIEIDGARLRANISTFKKLIGSDMMVVVKANAYGHGLEVVTPVIAEGADWLGVNCVDEALAITRLGVEKPIAILGHTSSDQIEDVVRNGYRQGLYRLDVAKDLSEWAAKLKASAKVHLKIETGTNRQGVGASDIEGFVRAVQKMPGLEIEGVYTHFANIEDTLDPSFARSQSRKFQEALSALDRAGVRPQHVHASATAGAVLYPELSFTMSRIGIGTYGIWPSRETRLAARERGRNVTLSPVLTWKTRVVQVKQVDTGDYVGYGLTYQATRPMQLVVLPVGYYDGYDRKLSNAGRALIRGRAVPVIGRVAMNMTMLDVTDVGAQLDDEVVLLGRQGDAEIRAEDLAEKIGSIPYEVLARLNPLIPRILK